MKGDIRIKRAYEAPSPDDGARVLVDRLWPRGLAKDKAALDLWAKDIAPSNNLRKAYHATGDYEAFREAYFEEMRANPAAAGFAASARAFLAKGPLTLVCGSREPMRSNASVLKEWLEDQE
ncbi:MAG: DUF488 family protein [Aeromonadales bacterium]|nr:DUF488 family protein [Aeromonadales bacterium]MDY2891097.1 DUF488 family protein [Succinivibrio sp.]